MTRRTRPKTEPGREHSLNDRGVRGSEPADAPRISGPPSAHQSCGFSVISQKIAITAANAGQPSANQIFM